MTYRGALFWKACDQQDTKLVLLSIQSEMIRTLKTLSIAFSAKNTPFEHHQGPTRAILLESVDLVNADPQNGLHKIIDEFNSHGPKEDTAADTVFSKEDTDDSEEIIPDSDGPKDEDEPGPGKMASNLTDIYVDPSYMEPFYFHSSLVNNKKRHSSPLIFLKDDHTDRSYPTLKRPCKGAKRCSPVQMETNIPSFVTKSIDIYSSVNVIFISGEPAQLELNLVPELMHIPNIEGIRGGDSSESLRDKCKEYESLFYLYKHYVPLLLQFCFNMTKEFSKINSKSENYKLQVEILSKKILDED